MNLFEMLALVAVGFLAGVATTAVRANNRRPLPRPVRATLVNRIERFYRPSAN